MSKQINNLHSAHSIIDAQNALRKAHSLYIRRQLHNRGYFSTTAFLVAAGFTAGVNDEGFYLHDPKMKSIFDSFLGMRNKLGGTQGSRLREALKRFDIDYDTARMQKREP